MEIAAVTALAALGYLLSSRAPIQERTSIATVPRKPESEEALAKKKFEAARNPLQTGAFVNKTLAQGEEPLPLFSSRNPIPDASVTLNKLELFTGRDALGGIGLRPPKKEKSAIFNPAVNFVPVSFSGGGGNINYVVEKDRYIASNMQQNVSCTQGFMDAPADPLQIRATPMVPHQKHAEMQLPSPYSGAAPVAAQARPTENGAVRKASEQGYRSEGLNAAAPYDYRPVADTQVSTLKLSKVQPMEYYGGPKFYVADEWGAPCQDATRTGHMTVEHDYYGSGTRVVGGPQKLVGEHQDTRKTMAALPQLTAAAPSIRPDTLTNLSEYQPRVPQNSETPYSADQFQNRPTTILPAQFTAHYDSRRVEEYARDTAPQNIFAKVHMALEDEARPKVGSERLNPGNQVSRAVGTVDRHVACLQMAQKDDAPFNIGHAAVAAVPLSAPDKTRIENAECRDKVIVYDPPVQPQRAYATEKVEEGQSFCKKTVVPVERSAIQPVMNMGYNQMIPEVTTMPKHCDVRDPHPPIAHIMDLDNFAPAL